MGHKSRVLVGFWLLVIAESITWLLLRSVPENPNIYHTYLSQPLNPDGLRVRFRYPANLAVDPYAGRHRYTPKDQFSVVLTDWPRNNWLFHKGCPDNNNLLMPHYCVWEIHVYQRPMRVKRYRMLEQWQDGNGMFYNMGRMKRYTLRKTLIYASVDLTLVGYGTPPSRQIREYAKQQIDDVIGSLVVTLIPPP